MVKFVYTLFLGLILSLFIGLGISTFYEGPKAPDYPSNKSTSYVEDESTRRDQAVYEENYKTYTEKSESYNRNVSIISLVAAIVMVVVGFAIERRNAVISGGVVLGGFFTLIYSIIRGFVSTDTKYTFMVVTVGVLVALYLGYRKFSHVIEAESKSKKRKK